MALSGRRHACSPWKAYSVMHKKTDKSIFRCFIYKMFKKQFHFFTCILPGYVFNESIKEFWKNRNFENMRAGFLRRCQISLRQKSPEIMHFQAWKNILTNIMSWLLIQLRFRHIKHLKMTDWTSFLCGIFSCSWPKNGQKWSQDDRAKRFLTSWLLWPLQRSI